MKAAPSPEAGAPIGGLPAIDAEAWDDHFAERSAQSLVSWALERWHDRAALVTSFQAGGMVLLHMAWSVDPGVRVLTLDTGRLPQETFDVIEAVRRRFGISVRVVTPDPEAVGDLVAGHGPNLFYQSPELRRACCRVRKVEPLERALAGSDAWITGLRRDQAASRRDVPKVAEDGPRIKLAPLADWSEDDVESYVREHRLPRHPLASRGYRSIGCAPCTRPVASGADPRSGRWWWERGGQKECGLHVVKP